MADLGLDIELINAIDYINKQFGADVLAEDRFVNILADVYKSRSNPAILSIMKSIVKEGIVSELLRSNKSIIKNDIAKNVNTLSLKYGYDKTLIEDILYSLSIGCGVISKNDYLSLTQKSVSNPVPPQPSLASNKNNNPNKTQNRATKKTKHKIDWGIFVFNFKYSFRLFLGFMALLITPYFFYAGIGLENGLLFFLLLALLAFVHFLLILSIGVSMDEVRFMRRNHHPIIGGIYSGLLICTCLFWALSHIGYILIANMYDFVTVYHYYSFNPDDSSPFLFFTFLISLFCAFFCIVPIPWAIVFSGISFPSNNRLIDKIRIIWHNKSFRNGLFFSCVFFFLYALLYLSYPKIMNLYEIKRIEQFNNKVDLSNLVNDSIRAERSKDERDLSFMDFKLGSRVQACINIANNSSNYSIVNEKDFDGKKANTGFVVNGNNYGSITERVRYIETEWDNQKILINLHCLKGDVVGISFNTRIERDSLLSIFSQKYGVPEYFLDKEDIDRYYSSKYKYLDYHLIPKSYTWTYNNGIIQLSQYDNNANTVTYFDRRCEILLQEKERKLEAERQAEEKRYQDSIQRKEQLRRQQLEEERRERERNHQESIDKI